MAEKLKLFFLLHSDVCLLNFQDLCADIEIISVLSKGLDCFSWRKKADTPFRTIFSGLRITAVIHNIRDMRMSTEKCRGCPYFIGSVCDHVFCRYLYERKYRLLDVSSGETCPRRRNR